MNKRELILMLEMGIPKPYWTPWGVEYDAVLREKLNGREVGDIFGVSRQRIHQIASNPKWTGITGRPRKKDESNYLGFTEEEYLDLRHNACDDTIG